MSEWLYVLLGLPIAFLGIVALPMVPWFVVVYVVAAPCPWTCATLGWWTVPLVLLLLAMTVAASYAVDWALAQLKARLGA